MATLALAANIAMIGGHFSEMVQVFVYPLITQIRNRIRCSNTATVDRLTLVGEELESCQQNLRGMLDFLEGMAQDGMQSERDCEYMEKLVREHGVLDQETSDLSGTFRKNGSHREGDTCFETVGILAHKVKLFQLKVQMFSSEKRRGRIVNLMQVPSRFSTIQDPEKGSFSTAAPLPPHMTFSLSGSSLNVSSDTVDVLAQPQAKSCPDDAAPLCACPETSYGSPSINRKLEGDESLEPELHNPETIKLSGFTSIKEYIRLQVGDTKPEV
ncbi:hypothetical protein E1B28_000235 [Marasmius oreades]|uniref:Uncharacterized protein n=1 Tax=Marasmius oreades TaxID=181124 RepID=A0A9P7V0X3_9AGAR|nr:uncharacterized protein E1B28_000235 [Marasmius oreades]KAG7098273.1 hypothetical protein E1B28_000235 [Marasmius oreades]